MNWTWGTLLLLWLVALVVGRPHGEDAVRHRTLAKLQEVFGLTAPEGRQRPQVAPQFMVELYHGIADRSGVAHGRAPFDAKVVRSFIEKDTSNPRYFVFNVTGMPENERLLEAQLRLFRTRHSLQNMHPSVITSPNYLVRVYQVLDPLHLDTPDAHRLLGVQYVSAHASGWQVFNVKQAVSAWLSGTAPNLGLLVTASTLFGDDVELNFARRDQHHNSHQPILVTFNDEINNGKTKSGGYPKFDSNEIDETTLNETTNKRRKRRSVSDNLSALQQVFNSTTGNNSGECERAALEVKFEDIGWGGWVVSPRKYKAFYCRGHCNYPLSQSQQPTNHATVQSIVHELGLATGVGKPCCVPNSLGGLSLLYLDQNENAVIKLYEDMVAKSCGCH